MEDYPSNDPIRPIQPYFWPLDIQLRKEALDNVLTMLHSLDLRDKKTAEDLVKQAEVFYNFLRGQYNEKEETDTRNIAQILGQY